MKTQPANPAADGARQLPHTLVLEERKRLTVTGILAIVSYDAFTVTLETSGGTLAVGGEGLTVSELSVQTGEVKIGGTVEYIQYTVQREKQGSFFKRLVR